MEQTELIYLIEDAEQGGDLHTIESGKAARVELDNINKQLAALREAVEKMAKQLEVDNPNCTALAEWEVTNK